MKQFVKFELCHKVIILFLLILFQFGGNNNLQQHILRLASFRWRQRSVHVAARLHRLRTLGIHRKSVNAIDQSDPRVRMTDRAHKCLPRRYVINIRHQICVSRPNIFVLTHLPVLGARKKFFQSFLQRKIKHALSNKQSVSKNILNNLLNIKISNYHTNL